MTLSSRARWVILGFSALLSIGSCTLFSFASYASSFASASGRGQSNAFATNLSIAVFVLVVIAGWMSTFVSPKLASSLVFVPLVVFVGGFAIAAVVQKRGDVVARAHSDAALAARLTKFNANIAPMPRDFVCPDDEAYYRHAFITHDRARGVLIHFRWNDSLTDLYAEPIGRVVGDRLEWFHGVPNAEGSNSRAYDECVDAEGRTVRQVYRGTNAESPRREDYGLERFRL